MLVIIKQIQDIIWAKLELILTVIGFVITIIELIRTKKAVEASNKATKNTLQLLTDRTTIADIAHLVDGLRETQTALRGQKYEIALIHIQALEMKLFELRNREYFKNNDRLTVITTATFKLKKMQDNLEKKLFQPDLDIPIPTYNNSLGGLMNQMSEWSEGIKFLDRSDKP